MLRGDNHDPRNLRAACRSCHKKKTQAEAQEARRKKRALRFRPQERHPGAT
ncbi:HNH endonuclease [Corynebacterium sp. NML120713]|uniref:HNH endonuclease n=1 Tax=Corynebacterium sp. NML120713 TaxID=1906332 RepID=UPI00210150EF|nr:HNH endonuclease [Corynebacterium sp. NML120713]